MAQQNVKFSTLVSLSGIEYPEQIDLGLVGWYVFHKSDLIDVLVLSDAEQKLPIKNISPKDILRFECKLMGTKHKFLGSVSFSADKLLAIAPGESWSQLFPLFGEGESDEWRREFGDVKVVPPCILLTFQPTELTSSSKTSKQSTTITTTKQTTTKKSTTTKTGKKTKKDEDSKQKKQQEQKESEKERTLEEKVVAIVEKLGHDMETLQASDRTVVDRLEILSGHHGSLQQRHPDEVAKREKAETDLNNLTQIIEENMKPQDRVDIDELGQSKEQLTNDVNAATNDLDILIKDIKDLNEYITDKSGEPYDTHNGTAQKKQKAIRTFLLNTLKGSDDNIQGVFKENDILKRKVDTLRAQVKGKFLNPDGISDQEINSMLLDYEKLLDEHADIFKQLDDDANESIDEFGKHEDLWKKLFTDGMLLDKKWDDIEYDIEDLTDKEGQLRKMKGDLDATYGDYIGKLRYINEQQKGNIDELKSEISNIKTDITDLRRQHDNAAADLAIESKAFARGRNTKDDQNLENLTNDIIGVHQERRREQDEGEHLYDDWVKSNKDFLDRGISDYEASQRDRGNIMRIQEILDQINQSNKDIERLLSDLQRLERDKSINTHRTELYNDMNRDLQKTDYKSSQSISDLRSRLDAELTKREKIIVELKDYSALQRSKADIYGRQREEIDVLIKDIEELRAFLRERYFDEEAELEELGREIEAHKNRLRDVINEINELRILIIEEEHHNDIKRNLLRNRDEYIERLRIAIGGLNKKPEVKVQFIVTPGDDIDAMLAEKMKAYGITIPLTRLGGGFYLFGTRKIFAKIMNGKLVVRVGGGYMIIDEFLATYSDMELIRINKMMEKEGVDAYEDLKVYRKYKDENPEAFKKIDPLKRTLIKSPKSKPKPEERGKF